MSICPCIISLSFLLPVPYTNLASFFHARSVFRVGKNSTFVLNNLSFMKTDTYQDSCQILPKMSVSGQFSESVSGGRFFLNFPPTHEIFPPRMPSTTQPTYWSEIHRIVHSFPALLLMIELGEPMCHSLEPLA